MMTSEKAETIALQALAFVMKEEELLDNFLLNTGLTPQDLRHRFRDPELLGGVLDLIMTNDEALLDCCNALSISPETLIMARRALPGASFSD